MMKMKSGVRATLFGLGMFISASNHAIAGKALDEVVDMSGLSGSFLAAQNATRGNDEKAAAKFLKKALKLDPENEDLKRNYFHALIANGEIEKAVELATQFEPRPKDGHIVTIVNAVDQLRKRGWKKSAELLAGVSGSDLDNLVSTIAGAWAKIGMGNQAEALKQIDALEGPSWTALIVTFHQGLMQSISGDEEGAAKSFREAIKDNSGARIMADTYIHGVYALAETLLRLEKADEAKTAIENGLKIFPNHPLLISSQKALANGAGLEKIVTNPQEGAAQLFYDLGNVIGREGGTSFAKIYLQIARYLNPESGAIAISLASVAEREKKPELANKFYDEVGKDSIYHRRATLETAINLNILKKDDEAVALLRTLIDEEPDDLVPFMTLGRILNQHKRYREASEVFDQAIAKIKTPQPRHWDFYYRRAISYERLKNWDKAELDFKKALKLSPNRASVLNYLGYSWVDMGIHLEEGLDMIRKAIKLRPRAGFIVDSLGWAYFKLGRYEEAAKELEKAVKMLPGDPVINDHLGDAYWKTGRKLEATFQWNHALASEPTKEDAAKIRDKLKNGYNDAETPKVADKK